MHNNSCMFCIEYHNWSEKEQREVIEYYCCAQYKPCNKYSGTNCNSNSVGNEAHK